MENEVEKRKALMKQIRDEIVALKDSPLYSYRVANKFFPVIGEGSHMAHIMFIGEAPGANEAKTGKPFCGASGRILDELLISVGIARNDVYVTNIVKDRPPENRDPLPSEIEMYGPFLDRQIEIIKPKVIATLGRYSMNYIMKHLGLDFEIEPIGKAHGKNYEAKTSYGTVDVIPLYHPATALYNGSLREVLKEDFKILKKYGKEDNNTESS